MVASARVEASTLEASRRMHRIRQKDTSVEAALRVELHARGLRFRIQVPVMTQPHRVADIAFGGQRFVVCVDSCFWHSCALHAAWLNQNATFKRATIAASHERDRYTSEQQRADGLKVGRVWAHELPKKAATRIATVLENRKKRSLT